MEKKSIVNVPFIAYEKEMSGKNKIITLMSIIILTLIISIVFNVGLYNGGFYGNGFYGNTIV